MGLLSKLGKLPQWLGIGVPSTPVAQTSARSEHAYVKGVKDFDDPLFHQFDRKAYELIRRTLATAHPFRKQGIRISARQLKACCPSDPTWAEELNEKCISKIPNLESMVRHLVWADLEGYRVVVLNSLTHEGWIVPDPTRGGRKKFEAGGNVEWDGQNVYKVHETGGYFVDEDARRERTLPRERCIVHATGAESNPHGDTDFAMSYYQLAVEGTENRKNIRLYGDRHGVPRELIKEALDNLTPKQTDNKLSTAANKLLRANKLPLALDKTTLVEMLEPGGATWNFLIEQRREIRTEAMMLYLQNAMASAPAATGPDQRGNAEVNKTDEDIAADCVAKAIAASLSVDMKRFIEYYNPHHCYKRPYWYLELAETEVEAKLSPTDVRSFAKETGKPVMTEDFYGSHNLQVPPGTPDVIVIGTGGEMLPVPEAPAQPAQPEQAPPKVASIMDLKLPVLAHEQKSPVPGAAEAKVTGPVTQPVAPGPVSPTDATAIADTALNGAQVTSLLDIITQVSDKTLAPEAAKIVIRKAYPTFTVQEIDQMVNAATNFEPAAKEPALPFGGGGIVPSSSVQKPEDKKDDKKEAPNTPIKPETTNPFPPKAPPKEDAKAAHAHRHFQLSAAKSAETEIAWLQRAADRELREEITKAFLSIATQVVKGSSSPKSPKSTTMAVAKMRAIADLTGRLRFRKQAAQVDVRYEKLATQVQVDFETAMNLPFEEAIRTFAKKNAVSADTAAKVAKAYKEGQFAGIKFTNDALAAKAKSMLEAYLSKEGATKGEFIGWLTEQDPDEITDAYADLVFRNNISNSYSEGQYQEYKDLKEEFGGWKFMTAGDESVRPTHALLDGKVFPNDGYEHLMPPLDHNCRCTWVPVDFDETPLTKRSIDSLTARAEETDPDAWAFSKGRKKYGE